MAGLFVKVVRSLHLDFELRPCASDVARTGHLYPLPHSSMLYRVRFQFGFLIDAASKDEAYAKALRKLRESPESAISGIQPEGEANVKRSLINRLWTGQ